MAGIERRKLTDRAPTISYAKLEVLMPKPTYALTLSRWMEMIQQRRGELLQPLTMSEELNFWWWWAWAAGVDSR